MWVKRIAGALLALAALSVPSVAGASQVVGQTAPSSSTCFTSDTYRQISVSGGAAYNTATRGVISSWSTFGGPAASQTLQLVTMHANPSGGAGNFIFDGADVVRDIAPNKLNTFSSGVRVPIVAGGEIGAHVPLNSQASCIFNAPAASDAYAIGPGDATVGGTANFVGSNPMARVNASAVVEPDADGDVFGDETQDKCLGSAGAFNGCPSTVTINGAKQKGRKPKIKVTTTVPGAGTLKAGSANDATLASASRKASLKAISETITATSRQQVSLTLKLTKSAKRKLAEKGKLKAQVKVVYTPIGGPGASQTRKVKLKG
jgi:hypothetical protein